jgi:hypothetical protein
MKATWMAGALAVALWGGAAVADDTEVEVKSEAPATDSRIEGSEYGTESELGTGGAGDEAVMTTEPSYTEVQVKTEDDDDDKANMRGLTWALGGGVEGYTGALAPTIQPGPAWGVMVALKPTSVLGLEFAYSGATNEIDNGADGFNQGAVSGADIVRNGGHVAATIGLAATAVQPYVLGGVGVNRYNARGGAGFRDDTAGNIPLGAGLRTHIGNFTADARLHYSVLFDNEFASVGERDIAGLDTSSAGRWNGMLQLGSTF